MTESLLIFAFFGFAYFFQSLFGFGASFIAVMGLSLFISTEIVIGMLPVTLIVITLIIVLQDRKHVQWRIILTSLLISVPGVRIGTFILDLINPDVVIIIVSVLILLHCLSSLLSKELTLPGYMIKPALVVSGLVIGGTGLGIPYVPIIMQKIKNSMDLRVSLNFLWCCLAAIRLPLYVASGIITMPYLIKGVSAIPVAVICMLLGRKAHLRFANEAYRKTLMGGLALITLLRLIISILQL